MKLFVIVVFTSQQASDDLDFTGAQIFNGFRGVNSINLQVFKPTEDVFQAALFVTEDAAKESLTDVKRLCKQQFVRLVPLSALPD